MIGQQVSKSHRHLVNLRHFVAGGKFIRKQHDHMQQNMFTQKCEYYNTMKNTYNSTQECSNKVSTTATLLLQHFSPSLAGEVSVLWYRFGAELVVVLSEKSFGLVMRRVQIWIGTRRHIISLHATCNTAAGHGSNC